MKTFIIDGKEYAPGVWYIVGGNFIFMLNENGTNKFHIQLNGGRDTFGNSVSQDRVEALTHVIATFLNDYSVGA